MSGGVGVDGHITCNTAPLHTAGVNSSGGEGAPGGGGDEAITPVSVSRERMMDVSEATATNSKLPPGWRYVPSEDTA